MEEAKAKMEKEKEAAQTATQEVADLLSWADTFDEANAETKHMIIAQLVERIEINHDYEVEIKFRISVEQYIRIAAYGQTERLPQGDEPCGSLFSYWNEASINVPSMALIKAYRSYPCWDAF